MLEELPHVGSIVSGDDEERVIRLLRTLRELIDERARAFARIRAGTVTEYRELADEPETPRILLLVDGMAAFREAYDYSNLTKWFTTFVQIATRSEEHTSELQSRGHLVCRLLIEKKRNIIY